MQRLPLAWIGLAVLAAPCGFAATARADGLGHIVLSPTAGPVCVPATPCMHSTDCSTPETCQGVALPSAMGQFCLRDLTSEIFCCVAGSGTFDCPTGTLCSRIGGGGGPIAGVCTGTGRDYCIADPTAIPDSELSRILSCVVPPSPPCVTPPPPRGAGPVPFAMGDCDADGLANSLDSHPCMADLPTCADGGVRDAAIALGDAGTTVLDAGTNVDAGDIGEPDLGTPESDAGDVPVDAGTLAIDAGTVPPGVSFRGAGGCACNLTAHDTPGAYVGVMMVALVFVRSRRSVRENGRRK